MAHIISVVTAAGRSVLFVTAMLLFVLPVFPQQPLTKSVIANYSHQRLDAVLQDISLQAGFHFSYDAGCIPFDSIVNYTAGNQQVQTVLKSVLPARVNVKEKGNYVILSCRKFKAVKKKKKPQEYIIEGYVRDRRSGSTIPYASVYDSDHSGIALSNEQGYYALNVPADKDVRLNIRKHLYEDTIIIVRPSDSISHITVHLTPSIQRMEKIKAGSVPGKSIEDVGIVNSLVPERQLQLTRNDSTVEYRSFNLSLVPGVSTNQLLGGKVVNRISVNLLGGYSSGVEGFEIGGLFNFTKYRVKGIQIAGLGNIAGGNTEGIQAAGLINLTLGKVYGLQLAGLSNIIADTLKGISVSGFASYAGRPVHGVLASGFSSVAAKDINGIQLSGNAGIALGSVNRVQASGFASYAGDVKGIQLSGFASVSSGNVKGLQLAGFANVSHSTRGAQISGMLNFSRNVRGFQLAPFNISDSLNGFALGLFTFARNGYHKAEINWSESVHLMGSFRTGMRGLHNILSLGLRYDGALSLLGGYGLGSEFPLGKKMFMTGSLRAFTVFGEDLKQRRQGIGMFDLKWGIRLFRYAEFTLGAAAYADYQRKPGFLSEYEYNIAPYSLYLYENQNYFLNFWLGGLIGLRVF